MLGHFPKGTEPTSGRIWLSGSKVSIAHRASHGTFYQAVKTNNSKQLSKNTLLQKDLSTVCFRKFYTHLQSSLLQASYCREPCDNATGNCPVNHPARQSWICGYMSWAPSPAKCRSTSSQLWQSSLLSKKWEPNMFSMLTLEPKNAAWRAGNRKWRESKHPLPKGSRAQRWESDHVHSCNTCPRPLPASAFLFTSEVSTWVERKEKKTTRNSL